MHIELRFTHHTLLIAFLAFVLAACSSGPTPPDGSTPPPRPPDPNANTTLSLGSLSLTPSLIEKGESVDVAFNVRNEGDGVAAPSTVLIYLNRDARAVTAGDKVLAELETPELDPGDVHEFNETVTLEGAPLGAYFLWVQVGAGAEAALASLPLGVALPACDASSEVVEIPDASFRQYLADALEVSGELSCGNLRELRTFEFGGFGKPKVHSLDGIQHAANLTEFITLGNTELEDLTPLQSLTTLTSLTASNLAVKDVAPLSQLRQLNRLDLSWNNLIEDLTPLKFLTELTELDLYYSQTAGSSISELLPFLTRLTNLNIGYSNLTQIEMLRGMTTLTRLHVGFNPLTDIGPLAGLTNLRELDVTKTGTDDLAAVSALVNLTSLSVGMNSVSDLSPLVAITGLKELSAGRNELSALDGLEELTELGTLNLSYNEIVDITLLANLTALTDLDLSRNAIEEIGTLQHLTNLRSLSLYENRITDIGALAGLTALEEVDLEENCLDLTPGSPASQVITQLTNRGVDVSSTFQNDDCS